MSRKGSWAGRRSSRRLKHGAVAPFQPRVSEVRGKIDSGHLGTAEPVEPATLKVGGR